MDDEILVKGTDGKWYILRGEEMMPYEEEGLVGLGKVNQGSSGGELPKGVSSDAHRKMEQKAVEPLRPISGETTVKRPPGSVLALPVISHEGHPLSKELEELIDKVMTESESVIKAQSLPWDDLTRKRFRAVVSARLRDVRDALETKAMLLRETKIGGLSLREPEAERILILIEKNFQEFNKKWRDVEAKKIAEWKKKQSEESAQRAVEEKKKEEEEIEKKRHMLLTQAGIQEKSKVKSQKSKVEEETKEIPNIQFPIPKPRTSPAAGETVQVSKVAPSIKPPSPLPAMSSLARQAGQPSPAKGEGGGRGVVPPLVRPKVIDVKFVPRLLNPIEELREMKLIDFRRLGRDPAEAIFKIKAKIDLLAEESFVKKMAGIEAWKKSEPARLYFVLSGEAVSSGRAIEAIIAEKEAKKELTLTAGEFHAIMELNRQLRF